MFDWLKSSGRRELRYPPSTDGTVLYAVGDIHGRSDLLQRAQLLIDQDVDLRNVRDRAIEVYLGDYVDRGPDSKGVIDLLIARSKVNRLVSLRGNHEIVMESFLRGQTPFEDWRSLGGLQTILSYGVEARILLERGDIHPRDFAEKIPISHLRFMSSLQTIYRAGPYCFVHAGLRPGVAIEDQSLVDLVWIREDFLKFAGTFGAVVVHGHTPVRDVEFLPNRINIDTGAFATNRLSIIRIDAEGASALDSAPR